MLWWSQTFSHTDIKQRLLQFDYQIDQNHHSIDLYEVWLFFYLPEHGDELRAPGGIVVVTAIATETGGDGGVEDIVFWRYSQRKIVFSGVNLVGLSFILKKKWVFIVSNDDALWWITRINYDGQ